MADKNFRCKITAELKAPITKENGLRSAIQLDTRCSYFDITYLLADIVESVIATMEPAEKAKSKAHIINYLMFADEIGGNGEKTIIDMTELREKR